MDVKPETMVYVTRALVFLSNSVENKPQFLGVQVLNDKEGGRYLAPYSMAGSSLEDRAILLDAPMVIDINQAKIFDETVDLNHVLLYSSVTDRLELGLKSDIEKFVKL